MLLWEILENIQEQGFNVPNVVGVIIKRIGVIIMKKTIVVNTVKN